MELDELKIYKQYIELIYYIELILKKYPIGNYTRQYFANIYLNEFDYFVKHKLRIKSYERFMDDSIF